MPIGKTVPVSASEDARSSLRGAPSLRVYEGLPHQTKEIALLQTELARHGSLVEGYQLAIRRAARRSLIHV